MPEPIAEVFVWVVYDPQKRVVGKSLYGAGTAVHEMLASGVTDETIAASEGLFGVWMQDKTLTRYAWNGYTIERLPLATPEMVAAAERYQWIRKQSWEASAIACVVDPRNAVKLGHDCPSLGRLDAAIDTARAGEGRRL